MGREVVPTRRGLTEDSGTNMRPAQEDALRLPDAANLVERACRGCRQQAAATPLVPYSR